MGLTKLSSPYQPTRNPHLEEEINIVQDNRLEIENLETKIRSNY